MSSVVPTLVLTGVHAAENDPPSPSTFWFRLDDFLLTLCFLVFVTNLLRWWFLSAGMSDWDRQWRDVQGYLRSVLPSGWSVSSLTSVLSGTLGLPFFVTEPLWCWCVSHDGCMFKVGCKDDDVKSWAVHVTRISCLLLFPLHSTPVRTSEVTRIVLLCPKGNAHESPSFGCGLGLTVEAYGISSFFVNCSFERYLSEKEETLQCTGLPVHNALSAW